MRHWLVGGLVAGMALLTTGCGFAPMYGGGGEQINPAADLSNFDVQIPRQRTAQLVRNALLRNVPPATIGSAPYVLRIAAKENHSTLLVTSDAQTKQQRLRLTVDYALFARDGKNPLTRGTTFADVPYTETREHFASQHARMQARQAAARKVAEDIRRRLAIFFAGQEGQ